MWSTSLPTPFMSWDTPIPVMGYDWRLDQSTLECTQRADMSPSSEVDANIPQ